MLSDIGLSELIVILVVVLIFSGPKGVSRTARDLGRLYAKLCRYKEKFEREFRLLSVKHELEEQAEVKCKIRERKDKIRRYVQQQMEAQSGEARIGMSRIITERLLTLEPIQQAKIICCYTAMPIEVQTDDLIRHFLEKGVAVTVPFCKSVEKELGLAYIHNLDTDLEPGTFGIREPSKHLRQHINYDQIDVILIPAIAYDKKINRLGHGIGYYDRFLQYFKSTKSIIGLAFDFQCQDQEIPVDLYDVKPDLVVTEARILYEKELNL